MSVLTFLLLWIGVSMVHGYKDPNYVDGRSVNVNLFEWKWVDIADECERFLGPKGYAGVQISPPNENPTLYSHKRPWWERYQPLSYALVTRSGNEFQLADMIRRCNNAGVRIYVDTVINHMTGEPLENLGTAGNSAIYDQWYYPAVPYSLEDFHWPPCDIEDDDYNNNVTNVRNCQLEGLKDLDQSKEHVREIIVNYMNKLIDLGVAGFRIDAADHMWPEDLKEIYDKLDDLNTEHGFPNETRPYIYQDVNDKSGNVISRDDYTPLAAVTDIKAGFALARVFRGEEELNTLANWGPDWDLLQSEDAFVFVENFKEERSEKNEVLTYKETKAYKGAIAFLLAYPFGEPQIMSGYAFNDFDVGPPMDWTGNTISPSINSHGSCGEGWLCQHRWQQIYSMVAFRNVVGNLDVNEFWDNGNNSIAFCRGQAGFIAFNNDEDDLDEPLQTCLPAGKYCDVISGVKLDDSCSGKMVTVDENGQAQITIGSYEFDMMLAIHIGPESQLYAESSSSTTPSSTDMY